MGRRAGASRAGRPARAPAGSSLEPLRRPMPSDARRSRRAGGGSTPGCRAPRASRPDRAPPWPVIAPRRRGRRGGGPPRATRGGGREGSARPRAESRRTASSSRARASGCRPVSVRAWPSVAAQNGYQLMMFQVRRDLEALFERRGGLGRGPRAGGARGPGPPARRPARTVRPPTERCGPPPRPTGGPRGRSRSRTRSAPARPGLSTAGKEVVPRGRWSGRSAAASARLSRRYCRARPKSPSA